MKTKFDKLFNRIVMEDRRFSRKHSIIKEDLNVAQEATSEDEQDEEDGMYQNFDISEMDEVTPEEAKKYIDELKEDDDIINNTLITIEQIFYKVEGFKEELKTYVSDEWGYDWSDIQDEQEMLFYALAWIVNEKKDLFESEEEWKKYYVLYQCEYQDSQSIIYPTWQQGRGIMDFFLEYFDEDQDED